MKYAKVVETKANATENRLSIRSGEKGTGKVIGSTLFWPNSGPSVDAAWRIIDEIARREGVKLVSEFDEE